MNILLLFDSDWQSHTRVRIADARCQHLKRVLKVQEGDQLKVGQWGGQRGLGAVLRIEEDFVDLRVTLSLPPPPRHPVTVILALPRPKMLRRVLRTCAEFGVEQLHIIHSQRVEKSFWQSPLLQPERIQEALRLGMERSGDTLPPHVALHQRFKPFIEDKLLDISRGQHIYVLHPGSAEGLGAALEAPATVLIGPEGGFIPYELELMQQQGALPRHLGDRVLSVDTAVTSALSVTGIRP